MSRPNPLPPIREALQAIHWEIVENLREQLVHRDQEDLSRVVSETPGDLIYALDAAIEGELLESLHRHLEPLGRFLVVCEGLGPEEKVLISADGGDPDWILLVDPIDGTRGLMYEKRSAWVLSGLAPFDPDATLESIQLAVQTEIPTRRSCLADQMWAEAGRGAHGTTRNLQSGDESPLELRPSRASSIRGGFATLTRFFPPRRDLLARLDDALQRLALGPAESRAQVFEDQYLSTGGQLQQLICGKDRFIGDLRAPLYDALQKNGAGRGHDCHPYDLSTVLIAREAGVIVTGPDGGPLTYPLDTTTPVSWLGFANEEIRAEVEPALRQALRECELDWEI